MESSTYLYYLNYADFEKDLCALEVRSLFHKEIDEKVFIEKIKVDPSVSPFLKNRLKILFANTSFDKLSASVKQANITATDFMVRYLKLYDDDPSFENRRKCCKTIGVHIQGTPLFNSPKVTYGITIYNKIWYFGILVENDNIWRNHYDKPYTYSSSLGIHTAKALINIAGNGDHNKSIVDPCCGVGTVLLEGVLAGYKMTGWEINRKIAQNARRNLEHFNYSAKVNTGDINNIEDTYDVSIIDLPYGNFSITSQKEMIQILRSGKRISKKMVIVSSKDISKELLDENLTILDRCFVQKKRKSDFYRYIWVCEKI